MTDVRDAPDFEEMYARGRLAKAMGVVELNEARIKHAAEHVTAMALSRNFERVDFWMTKLHEAVDGMKSAYEEVEKWISELAKYDKKLN